MKVNRPDLRPHGPGTTTPIKGSRAPLRFEARGGHLFHRAGRSPDTFRKREATPPGVCAYHGEKVTFITGPCWFCL